MNTVRSGSSLLLFAIVLAAASSCGGSSDGDNTPQPGSSGTGGSPSSGGMATAGTLNGGGGATTSGGSAAGGVSATAGTGGSTAGGSGGGMPGKGSFGCPGEKPQEAAECTRMIPSACTYDDGGCVCANGAWDCYSDADCPGSAPEDAATCALGGMVCTYDGDLSCSCSAMNGWSCSSPCPDAPPASDATCRRPAANTCRYAEGAIVQGFGMADTTCACEEGKFSCFSQADCPATAPENASACTFATLACPYDDRQCTCTDDAWSCVTECPEALPSDGTQCIRPAGSNCRYLEGAVVQGFGGKSDTTCACEEGAFSCFGQEDCPAAAPANAEACEFQSLSCSYEGAQCTCGESGWSCTTECPAAVPAQDSACSRPEQATCRYDGGMLAQGFGAAEAVCACREEKFDCLTQADCPATAPASEAACTDLTNLSCKYDGQQCTCGQNGWTCQTECPAQAPTAGATCTRPVTSACLYTAGALVEEGTDADSTCVCADGAFTCYSAADCPAAAPTGACDKPGLECTFADQECRCRTSTGMWSCMMSQPPAGGGAGGAGG